MHVRRELSGVAARTCGALFGDIAKDPRSTQAQLRHADPQITLQHYQQAVSHSVKAAAIALKAAIQDRNRTGFETEGVQ